MKGKIIALFGIDGAGKTTIAKGVLSELSSNGRCAVYVRPKFGLRPWSGSGESEAPPLRTLARHSDSTLLYGLRYVTLLVLMVEHLAALFRKVWVPLRQGKIVIVDRYWPDTIVDLVVDFAVPYDKARKIAFLSGLGAESIFIFLDVSSNVALARKPGPYSLEYLQRREIVYNRLAREIGAKSVRAEGNKDTTLKMTLSIALDRREGL